MESKRPEPGIYPGVSWDEYESWQAANHSILRHFRKTAAHARWEIDHRAPSSPYQALGHAIHMALLEPERLKDEVLVAPVCDRRRKEGRALWARFEAKAKGRTILREEEGQAVEGAVASLARHSTARLALRGIGANELSIVWRDPDTEVLCKGRIDRLTEIEGIPAVVDIKTTSKPASTHSWQKSVEEYGYHEQAAHYLSGLQALQPLPDGAERKFLWVVCETEPPYCVRVFEIEDAALSIGRDVVAKYLATYKDCLESGNWPGWPEGIDMAGLPAWVYKRFDLE